MATPMASENFHVEADCVHGSGRAGIRFRTNPDNEAGYVFYVQSSSFRHGWMDSAGWITLFTTYGASSGGVQRLRVVVTDDGYMAYTNGALRFNKTGLTRYLTQTGVGILATGTATVDNFQVDVV